MKKLHIFVLLYLSVHLLHAQSDLSNMYPLNNYLMNGADAGRDTLSRVFTGYRKQWNGISNSPSLGYLGLSARVGRNHGAGLLVEQSTYGLLSDLQAKISYAYHFTLRSGNGIHAGGSVGFANRRLQTSGVIASDYTDELLSQNSVTGTAVLSNIGIMFTSRRLQLGASFPQIISSSSENMTGFKGSYVFQGGYDVISDPTWLLQAIAVYRKNDLLKSETNIGARMLWKNQLGGGIGYRTLSGVFLRAELNRKNFSLAYGYEQGTRSSGKSHEVMVSFKFGKKKKNTVISEEASEVIPEPVTEPNLQNAVAIVADTATVEPVPQQEAVTAVNVVTPEVKKTPAVVMDSVNKMLAGERLIFFQFRSSDNVLSGNYESTITLVAQVLTENPELRILIVGHTCKLGSEGLNQQISVDRARQVYEELKNRGIGKDRMEYTGKGETEPIETGDSTEQLARNRRVQIVFHISSE
jgi:type IX secretion system PorP/SprF family membrane protein